MYEVQAGSSWMEAGSAQRQTSQSLSFPMTFASRLTVALRVGVKPISWCRICEPSTVVH